MTDLKTTFVLTAPGTDHELREVGRDLLGTDDNERKVTFTRLDHGIWDLTRPHRRETLDRFASQYAAVRAAEHRELSPQAIRALPEIDPTHPLADTWDPRAASYRKLMATLGEVTAGSVVDIGAGCGWLAARLADHAWTSAAVDVTVDGGDGLALARHHHADLFLARAEMEALPFASNTVNMAVFNASLHYATDVGAALGEAQRVLRPGGRLVVLDSPVFADPSAGHKSVAEFAEHVRRTHQLPVAQHEGPGFVTETNLAEHEASTGGRWVRHEPASGLRARFHKWRGARRAGRETAARPLLIMQSAVRP